MAINRRVMLALSATIFLSGCSSPSIGAPGSDKSAVSEMLSAAPPTVSNGGSASTTSISGKNIEWKQLSDKEWKARLTPEQYRIARQKGTEMAFTGKYWNEHGKGDYKCAVCGGTLFKSDSKFDSGTGWPSFTQPTAGDKVAVASDHSMGMDRNEVVCATCGAHLGHVFDDGPGPGGKRYCINSASLAFDPKAGDAKGADSKATSKSDSVAVTKSDSVAITKSDSVTAKASATPGNASAPAKAVDTTAADAKAQPADLPVYTAKEDDAEKTRGNAVAYFAGGCFWGTEDAFKEIKGVSNTIVGYTGGITKNPTYMDVCSHTTKHAEAVRVVYDPKVVNYKQLVKEFLGLHDPTTKDRQGPDVGDQYRSAIFYSNDQELKEAKEVIAAQQSKFDGHIVTSLEPEKIFYTAEDYHQDYFAKHPGQGCHVPRRHL